MNLKMLNYQSYVKLILLLINLIVYVGCDDVPPRLILISLDGFRGDYLHPKLTPFMYKLSQNGISTNKMKSCYVTKTFPNHLSIATGLYQEHHGIVNNKMYDSKYDNYFFQDNLEEAWWNDMDIKPIWNLNQDFGQGRTSACSMWPGSPVSYKGKKAKYVEKYKEYVPFEERIENIIKWLTMESDPANFVLMYINQPDTTQHVTGPYSPETKMIIKELDNSIEYLVKRLKDVNLDNSTNLIILSDHGMSEVEPERIVDLTAFVDTSKFVASGASPNLNLHLKNKKHMHIIYNQLSRASKDLPFRVYKKSEMPKKFHFNDHRRIGDIVLEADDGYSINLSTKNTTFSFLSYYKANGEIKKKKSELKKHKKVSFDGMNIVERFDNFPKRKKQTGSMYTGKHGYDNDIANMRPVFLATGPAFKSHYTHDTPFENIDVFPLVCSILGLSNINSTDKFCINDAQPMRIQSMLR